LKYFHVQDLLKSALDWIGKLGPWGPVIFVGLYVVATVCSFQARCSRLGLGRCSAWRLARCVYPSAQHWVPRRIPGGPLSGTRCIARKIEKNEKFATIDRAVADEGWKIVLLTRLSPVFPFTLLNYAFGLTRVKLSHYVLASWLGMIPAR
jgi:Uncharacterized conserved protein